MAPAVGRIPRPLPAMRVLDRLDLPACARQVGMGQGRAAITRAEINATGIPLRRRLLRTANGILLAARTGAAVPQALNRKPVHQVTGEVSTYSVEIVQRGPPGVCAVFPGKGTKFGKTLPPREIWYPSLNLFPPFTIRSAVLSQPIPGCSQTPGCLLLRASREDHLLRVVADFRAA